MIYIYNRTRSKYYTGNLESPKFGRRKNAVRYKTIQQARDEMQMIKNNIRNKSSKLEDLMVTED